MAKIKSKYIDLGTSSGQVNSRVVPANFTPTYYTPVQVGSEGTDKISSHLKGIDNVISSLGGAGVVKYTSTQALSSNWVADGSLYKQTVTLPGSLTMGGCMIQTYVSSTYELVFPTLQKGSSSTTFDIWTNDNSVTYNFVIIG